MKRVTFYRCVRGINKRIFAVKTQGYAEGDIGIHKEQDGFWVATHIPTGMRYTPYHSENPTIKAALEEAKFLISNKPDMEDLLQNWFESPIYKTFLKSKNRPLKILPRK